MGTVYGIDIGTSNFKMCCKDKEQILNEKNIIAIANKKDLLAFGDEAYEMYEKAPENIEVSFPVKYGVIADIENMQTLLLQFYNKINNDKKSAANTDFYIAVPTDVTEVEKRAFYELVADSKVKAKNATGKDLTGKISIKVKKPGDDAYKTFTAKKLKFTKLGKYKVAQTNAINDIANNNASNMTEALKTELNSNIKDVSDKTNALEDRINNYSLDGIFEETEKQSVRSMLRSLSSEKADIDNQFTVIYENTDLTGNYKFNLNSSYTCWDVYVAINAQFHDSARLYTEWHNNISREDLDDKIITSAVNFWFKDEDAGEGKVWNYFKNID